MKFQTAIIFSLLYFGALGTAEGRQVSLRYKRHALDTANFFPYPYAHSRPGGYPHPNAYRRAVAEIIAREAEAEAIAHAWTPKVEGKYLKDTLKCNNKHVCSGELVVAN